MVRAGLIEGADFDLDFHTIMHWGEDAALEKNYVVKRSQRTRSVLTFFAQDAGTHNLVYANADVTKAEQAREVIAFAEYWQRVAGTSPGLLVFDSAGVTGHPDHMAATAAGLLAAEMLNLPVLGWTLPETVAAQLNQELGASFIGHPDQEIDLRVSLDRTRQRVASHAHKSQALPSSVLWRRLELLGDSESLRWLHGSLGATVTP